MSDQKAINAVLDLIQQALRIIAAQNVVLAKLAADYDEHHGTKTQLPEIPREWLN